MRKEYCQLTNSGKQRFIRNELRKHKRKDCDCVFTCFEHKQQLGRTLEELKKGAEDDK